ncbi:sigma-54-dependent transcriptional regulator [Haoranjiania flava]|uniref:Sigma-54 dependent transcriptional regulator n=1 Tax=Haoranjiania flava TaxID=1856322 RepID=A0AAE3IMQ7_9BACT|nr:sigma-54 dependent transcriptional regulator [Haoranjiania flava]MCU7693890.1 sigma-54 dependent transcriptional regulator [Haoranjiania flava]
MKPHILIIDDEVKLSTLLGRILSLEGYEVSLAATCKEGWAQLAKKDTDVVLCDVKLPDGTGVELAEQIKARYPVTEIILLTAYGNIPDGVQAIKNGAFDYITKGDDNNRIIPLVYKAAEKAQLNKRVASWEKQSGNKNSLDKISGKSIAILNAVNLAGKVAATDSTVLLTGETGTGKEVFAQAIHQAGKRAAKSFVAINCSAFSKDLLEGELFGHKAGAFTGATKDQKGLLEEANNGTLFLDEIGEMPVELQAKILRVLENGEFIKIGETKPSRTNVRIISATNRDLKKEVEEGNFREDLYFRLSVFQIALPALRERKEDIPGITEMFIQQFAHKINKQNIGISAPAQQALNNYQWPGNIRELKNVIERAVILCEGQIQLSDLPVEIQSSNLTGKTLSAFSIASVEKSHIQKVLSHTKGNKAEAARLLEIGIATLYRKIEEYGIG